jgi:predicted ATP-grasp superfamily ATP-dependent carboligase
VIGRVLVTNVEERSSLAACRALSAAGYTVIGAASSAPCAGLYSRACSERFVVPDPRVDAAGFVHGLDDALRRHRADILLPGIDAALLALVECPSDLALVRAPGVPDRERLARSLDKLALIDAAQEVGLPMPPSIVSESPGSAAESAREIGFPLLVKPRTSVVGPEGHRRQQTGLAVSDEKQLAAAVAETGTPCLLQQFEHGSTVYSFGGVVAEGSLLGSCLARYRRTWPPDGGSAAYSETIDPPAGLTERVLRLVNRIGWEGIFELEFLGDDQPERTIDFNPRPYGSIALAVSAGANLPVLWCDWLLGRDPAPAHASAGFRYRWEEAELRFFVSKLIRGNAAAAASVFAFRPRTTHAIFRVGDPLPAAAEALRVPIRLAARTRRLFKPVPPVGPLDPRPVEVQRWP